MESFNIFPTLVYREKNFISSEECKQIVNVYENRKDIFEKHDTILGDSLSSHANSLKFNLDVLQEISEILEYNFKEKIKNICADYSRESGFGFRELENSWINIQNPGSSLNMHTHPFSSFSGALYLNVDNNSSKLYFINPNPFMSFTSINELTPYTFQSYWFQPENGDLIMFPSWLKHGSNGELNGSEKRVVLSFNTTI